jgi:alpha/beta superfamily hydrolase
MEKVTAHLVAAGMAVLRFNFRGVGASQGVAGDGPGVLNDLTAAMATARSAGLPMGLTGWSFGAATALRWQAATGDTTTYCGIAPSVSDVPGPTQLAPARRSIIMGERDQLISFPEAEEYARSIGATFHAIAADHFFYYREDRVAALVAASLTTGG